MSKKSTKSDLKRIDAMKDKDIDYSDILGIDADFFRDARVVTTPTKKQITLRLDDDMVEFFKSQGKGYQSRINSVLRAYYEAHRQT